MDQNTVNAVVAGAAILSAFAAMISAGVAAWSAHLQREASKPQIRVEVSTKMPVGIYGLPDVVLTIDIMNRGAFPVTISGVGFALRDKRTVPSINSRELSGRTLPARLEPGEALSFVHDIREMAQVHVSEGGLSHAYVSTAAGDKYVSEPIKGPWLGSYAT